MCIGGKQRVQLHIWIRAKVDLSGRVYFTLALFYWMATMIPEYVDIAACENEPLWFMWAEKNKTTIDSPPAIGPV